MRRDVAAPLRERLVDPRRQIEALFEIDINKMIAADIAVARNRSTIDVDAV
jgi:hypothetical protein